MEKITEKSLKIVTDPGSIFERVPQGALNSQDLPVNIAN